MQGVDGLNLTGSRLSICLKQDFFARSGNLMRETSQLKDSLPIHPNASILVRQVSY